MYTVKSLLKTICLFICIFAVTAELDQDTYIQLRLQHALNDDPVPNYVDRGNISMSSIRNGNPTVGQIGLTSSQIKQLKALAQNNGAYKLKAIVRSSSGNEVTLYTSTPACYLLGTDMEDTIVVWLDSAMEPFAVNLHATGPCIVDDPMTSMFTTSIQVKHPDGGPAPDTTSYIQKIEREREARERGDVKDNRSFIAKYWMYIVLAFLFLILTSAANPEAGGGGSAR